MSGQHRDVVPAWVRLRVALTCWLHGHLLEHLPNGYWLCTRCERIAPTAVELP